MHTGYKEGVGGMVYPSLGAIASAELGDPNFPLPNFVTIGNRSYGAGFLGAEHQPLIIDDPQRGVENLKPLVDAKQFDNRVGLLEDMEQGLPPRVPGRLRDRSPDDVSAGRHADEVEGSEGVRSVAGAGRRRRPPTAPAISAKAACWLAGWSRPASRSSRSGLGGWDTHQDNFDRVKNLSGQVDPAMSALITDLKERGLLD